METTEQMFSLLKNRSCSLWPFPCSYLQG